MSTGHAPRARRQDRSFTPPSPKLPDFSERTVLDLVGLIYDAAVQPPAWKIFLEKFAQAVRGGCTSLFWYDLRGLQGGVSYSVRSDPNHVRKYDEYYSGSDVWAAGCKQIAQSGTVFLGHDLCPPEEMEQTEFYNDFLRPMDAYHQLGGFISQEEPSFGVISTLRPKKLGPVEKEAGLLRLLMPHLQRAFQLHSRVLDLETRLEAATDALDRLPVGVILVDSEGKVLFANRAAMKIVNQRDGLSIAREGLTAGRSNEHAALRQLIHGASATSKGNGVHPGGMMLVSRPSLQRPFSLMVAPRPSNGFGLPAVHPSAVIFVTDPESELELDHAVLSRLYGLTPAEAKLATLLMQGKSLEHTAEELSISHETARTHLKHIFDKTSTHRQGELVRLLLTSFPQVLLR